MHFTYIQYILYNGSKDSLLQQSYCIPYKDRLTSPACSHSLMNNSYQQRAMCIIMKFMWSCKSSKWIDVFDWLQCQDTCQYFVSLPNYELGETMNPRRYSSCNIWFPCGCTRLAGETTHTVAETINKYAFIFPCLVCL